ncbi:MAG: hypothetical protein ABIN18_06245 [Pseudomonadota bacterium]
MIRILGRNPSEVVEKVLKLGRNRYMMFSTS